MLPAPAITISAEAATTTVIPTIATWATAWLVK